MGTTTMDRIEKQIVLRAPRSRVWRAISDSKEFGTWFQCVCERPFAPGARIPTRMTYPGYEHVRFEILVEAVEPERLLSFRWHPGNPDDGYDTSKDPMTLVEFRLDDADGGTRLTLIESGFDQLPVARRAAALKDNEGGWAEQMRNIERYLGEPGDARGNA